MFGSKIRVLALTSLLGFAAGAAAAQAGNLLDGEWTTADGSTRVRFEPCANELCGRIVWLRDGIDPATGQTWRDANNQRPELRSRPLIGLAMLASLKPDSTGGWSGSLYNPLDGRTYSGTLKTLDAAHLELSGCALAVICQREIWTRTR
jgi:uncharacterized protein (DUF2147 family)